MKYKLLEKALRFLWKYRKELYPVVYWTIKHIIKQLKNLKNERNGNIEEKHQSTNSNS